MDVATSNLANAMAQQSNYDGAWETVEKISADYPDDNKLSQTRANLTTQAADFVRTERQISCPAHAPLKRPQWSTVSLMRSRVVMSTACLNC